MKLLKKLLILLSMFILTQSLLASEEDELKKHFLNKLDIAINVVSDKNLDSDARNTKIVSLLTPMFDFDLMAKLSLGKKVWFKLQKQDRVKFVELYVERMKKSYSSKLDSYNNEKIQVVDITRKKNRIVLKTEVITKEKNIEVIYKFYKPKKRKTNKDIWLIYDVEIIGISILKADKAQFKEFLRTKSIYDLMKSLEKKKTN